MDTIDSTEKSTKLILKKEFHRSKNSGQILVLSFVEIKPSLLIKETSLMAYIEILLEDSLS